jgi:N-acyl-D-amino-acid deacylase
MILLPFMLRTRAIRGAFLLVLLCVCGSVHAQSAAPTTLIINASVVDGTGAAPRSASVRIGAERILEVGDLKPRASEKVVDARGLVIAPGFIDTHSHHDLELFEHPQALSAVSQGITTIVVGQDGMSTHPLADFFKRIERNPGAVNVAAYVGHNSIRAAVMGEDFKRTASDAEIRKMRTLVREAMRAGALGFSTGLEYDPGIYSTKEEILTLAKEAARHGGRYITHIRSEDRQVWEAVDEVIEIGRRTRMPVQVSHIKLAMTDWWGQAQRLIDRLEAARRGGVDITADIYPYEYWQSTLTVLFPDRDFDNRQAAEFALKSLAPPEGLRISRFSPDRALEGKTVAAIAAERGTDAATSLMSLIAASRAPGAEEEVIGTSMHARDIDAFIMWPHSNICSDGSLVDAHPRGAGSFTKILREYVRERRLLTLEEAVRKMSSVSAAHVGITDRGTIQPGMYADLVLFDVDKVADRATLERPGALSEGIASVWVNGEIVFSGGKALGPLPGRLIRRTGRSR